MIALFYHSVNRLRSEGERSATLRNEQNATFETFLIACLLPANVASDLMAVQDELYRRTGNPSTRALPPLIPAAWLADAFDVDSIPEVIAPRDLRFEGYVVKKGVLAASVRWRDRGVAAVRSWLDIELEGPRLLASSPRPSADRASPPIPTGDHAYIALVAPDASVEKGETVQIARFVTGSTCFELPPLPSGEISVYRIACLQVRLVLADSIVARAGYEVLTQRWVGRRR